MHGEPSLKSDLVALQRGLMSEADARGMLERIRWPNGLACLECGSTNVGRVEAKGKEYTKPDGSKRVVPARHLFKCRDCKKQFSVTKGTIFEDSKIPLQMWITVMYRMCSSKRGISAHQIHREMGIGYEAAWFMVHRIRWAMTDKNPTPMVGVIEADETYVGGKPRGPRRGIESRGRTHASLIKEAWEKKVAVVGLLERGGRVRAQVITRPVNRKRVQANLMENIDAAKSVLITDESWLYGGINKHLPHGMVRHRSEYVRGTTHTQGIESFWSILKRGLIGTYYHVDEGYLNQYVQEFAFRHNARKISDADRFKSLLGQVDGRLDWYVGKNAGEPS